MTFWGKGLILLLAFGAVLVLGQALIGVSAAQSNGQYFLFINESAIGNPNTGTYYPAGSVVNVQAAVSAGSPWCISMAGTGSGSFSGTVYPPATSFNVTMDGDINETASFVQCGSILPPLAASLESSPPPAGSGGQVLLNGSWSGGVSPYNVSLTSGRSPFCSMDNNLVDSAYLTWHTGFSLVMAQNAPTYYCLNVSDSGKNVTLVPSLYVSAVGTTSTTTTATTTTALPTTVTICTSPYCTQQHTVSTTAFPTVPTTTNTTSTTVNVTPSTTTIPVKPVTRGSKLLDEIVSFFRNLFSHL